MNLFEDAQLGANDISKIDGAYKTRMQGLIEEFTEGEISIEELLRENKSNLKTISDILKGKRDEIMSRGLQERMEKGTEIKDGEILIKEEDREIFKRYNEAIEKIQALQRSKK